MFRCTCVIIKLQFDLDANAASTAEGVNTYTLDMLLDEKEHKVRERSIRGRLISSQS